MTTEEFVKALVAENENKQAEEAALFPPSMLLEKCGEAKEVIRVSLDWIANKPPTDKLVTAKNILQYMDVQLDRLIKWVDGPIDLNALVNRNLMEVKEWAEYVAESDDNVIRFAKEQCVDLFEVGQKWIKDAPETPTGLVAEFYKSLGIVYPAKRVQHEQRGYIDDNNYKFCSKLIHPSSLIINNLEFLDNDGARRTCQMHALRLTKPIFSAIISILKSSA